jgi:transcriptional repressor NrdR
MQCPFCKADDTKVIDSRLVAEGMQTRRRRECVQCAERFTTYETIEITLPRVIKHDGSCVQFQEEKLRAGILRAIEKRPVRIEQVESAIQRIMNRLRGSLEREIETRELGEWVMLELRALDEVAYVRFASVYRRFQDVDEFQEEIARLRNTTIDSE